MSSTDKVNWNHVIEGYHDIKAALRSRGLARRLAWQEITQRYRRSTLGPLWITLSLSIMIATMGLIFSQLYHIDPSDYLPFLCSGLIIWNFVSNVVSDSCSCFMSSQAILKQLPIPLFTYPLKLIYKNLIISFHNIIIFPIVLIIFHKNVGLISLLSIPGLVLLILNISWISIILALISTRYRDFPQLVNSMMQIITYVTPIMWMPKSLSANAYYFLVHLNPVHHILNVVRAPLLGDIPSVNSWILSSISAIIGWTVTLYYFGKLKNRVVLWI